MTFYHWSMAFAGIIKNNDEKSGIRIQAKAGSVNLWCESAEPEQNVKDQEHCKTDKNFRNVIQLKSFQCL